MDASLSVWLLSLQVKKAPIYSFFRKHLSGQNLLQFTEEENKIVET
jgi:hypothetical protein